MSYDKRIMEVKKLRHEIKFLLEHLQFYLNQGGSRESVLCKTKLQEGSMWLGMELRRLADDKTCYEKSEDMSNAEVDDAEPEAPVV